MTAAQIPDLDVFEGLSPQDTPHILNRLPLASARRTVCGLALQLLHAGTTAPAFSAGMLGALSCLVDDATTEAERTRLVELRRAVTEDMVSLGDLATRLNALRAQALAYDRILRAWPAKAPGAEDRQPRSQRESQAR